MEDIREMLSEREKTHGSYKSTAEAYNTLKQAFEALWLPDYRHPHRELYGEHDRALTVDAIAMKLARILSGDSRCVDHWRDIAGYATLQAQTLEADTANPLSPGYACRKENGSAR